jgi:hypothetical protein
MPALQAEPHGGASRFSGTPRHPSLASNQNIRDVRSGPANIDETELKDG